ncbi:MULTISPECIES: hypothetical protein [Streptomyces]|uniref:hypothetical protein n=1 Tax=Streptomyces TaxID=1883 RepID=UPI00268CEFD7
MLESLARVLRLDDDQRAYLYELAAKRHHVGAGTEESTPSRLTRAVGALRAVKAATARSALTSWTTPATVFTVMTSGITEASGRSP